MDDAPQFDPDRILDGLRGNMQFLVILGYDHGGNEVLRSSEYNPPEILFLLERFKFMLMQTDNQDMDTEGSA